MAWTKDVKMPTGVIVGFWKIEKVFVNFATSSCEISYLGYVSKDEYGAGSVPVVNSSFILDAKNSAAFLNEALQFSEVHAMEQEYFSGAEVD